MKKQIKATRMKLDILSKLIILFVTVPMSITSIYAMESHPDEKSPQHLNDLNRAVMRFAQECKELRQSVDMALHLTGNCAIDLRLIITYLGELAKDYMPENPTAHHIVLSAHIALDHLDTCINQRPSKTPIPNPRIPLFMPSDQRRHFIEEEVGKAYFGLFNMALEKLRLTYPR